MNNVLYSGGQNDRFCSFGKHAHDVYIYIDFSEVVKTENFSRKSLIFFLFLLKA